MDSLRVGWLVRFLSRITALVGRGVWVTALAVLVAGHGWPGRADAAAVGPNIVVIMADDLDVLMTENMLSRGLLPNIKANVVDRGVNFRGSFVTNPVCCPSRATYLTGRYSHNHDVLRNNAPHGSVSSLADSSTLATWLHGAGYRTAHVGKYLNGYGLDPSVSLTSPQNPAYVPPGWDEWYALVGSSTYQMYGYAMNDNGTIRQYGTTLGEYQTAMLSEAAALVVSESLAIADRPLFLTVTPLAPHVEVWTILPTFLDGAQYPDIWKMYIRPDMRDMWRKPFHWNLIFQSPLLTAAKASFNEADTTDKPAGMQRPALRGSDITNLLRQYRMAMASMMAVDDLVGTVARSLGDQLANTVFFFTSDNGNMYGEHRLGGKTAPYEEAIRVPLYVSGPGVIGGRSVDALVLNNDLAPTIAELAGAALSSVDGRSFVPLLRSAPPPPWRRRFLVEHLSANVANDLPSYAAIRTGPTDDHPSRLYVEYFGSSASPSTVTDVELYDLAIDPAEMDNRSADPTRAAERADLHERLALLESCGPTRAPCQSAEE